MTNEGWSVLLGTAAGFCTTVSFVPQVIKIYRQGGRDLSYGMLSLYLVGGLLWFGYGVVVRAQAVIITNLGRGGEIFSMGCLVFIWWGCCCGLAMGWWCGRRR